MAGIGIAVAAVVGAGASIYAANKASNAQSDAAAAAAGTQLAMYNQTRADLAPYRETGYKALSSLADLFLPNESGAAADYSAFYESPGYNFRFDEGLRALDRSAAARGRLQSGGYGRELERYGQGVASNEFNNYVNRISSLAGIGQSSSFQTASLGQQTAANVGNNLVSAGAARASGYVGAANAINQGIGNGVNNYFAYQAMQNGAGPTAAQANYANAYGGDFYAY